MVRLAEKTESQAAEGLKRAAIKLFAQRGVDGVTVRQIAAEAGQKNHGAVGYYFGSKEALIRELVIDGARLIDARRNEWLDQLETGEAPMVLRDVINVLVYPSIDLETGGDEECYNRFVVLFSMAHRDLFIEMLDGKWNRGFQRCVKLMRGWMQHLSKSQQTERIVFIESYLGSVLSARESRLADASRTHATWSRPDVLVHFVTTIEAIVKSPAEPA